MRVFSRAEGDASLMRDGELRALCNRFLDAVERGDIDAVAGCYAPGFTFWANVIDTEQTREENLQTVERGKGVHRRRTYDDRMIDTFSGGFISRYSVNVVQHDGKHRSLWACIVARCKDGQITHIDEYLDSSKFSDASRKAAPE